MAKKNRAFDNRIKEDIDKKMAKRKAKREAKKVDTESEAEPIKDAINLILSDKSIETKDCLEIMEDISSFVENVIDGLKGDLEAQEAKEEDDE